MKNFNKLFLLAFGLMVMVSVKSEASVVARMPKEVFVSTYTTGIVQITPAISTNAASTAAYMPGAVYQVILSSGASAEYYQLYDSTTSINIVCGQIPAVTAGIITYLGPRLLFGSTTANSVTTFDPPLVFHSGLQACDSAVTGQASVTYELGRGLSGQ